MSVLKILGHRHLWYFKSAKILQKWLQNMIYIVAFGVGLRCPRKIHLNTQCPYHALVHRNKTSYLYIRLECLLEMLVTSTMVCFESSFNIFFIVFQTRYSLDGHFFCLKAARFLSKSTYHTLIIFQGQRKQVSRVGNLPPGFGWYRKSHHVYWYISYLLLVQYGNTGCGVFKGGIQN